MRRMAVGAVPGVVLVLALSGLLAAPPARAASGPISSATVVGSPFYPNGDGVRESVRLRVVLARAARLDVAVVNFDGNRVVSLGAGMQRSLGTYWFRWDGRDGAARVVDDGPYRFRVTATDSATTQTRSVLFTKAAKVIYPARPKAIVVAVDPGHGDVYSERGRVTTDGTREAVVNLDIGLRLQAMLEGAGVRTVITRTLDQGANTPEWDRTGNGVADYEDELEARCDIANAARADVFVAIHNNFATNTKVGGPSTYYWPERPYSGESYRLAQLVQANMLARLDLYRTATWYPSRSHGVLTHGYYVLHQYNPPHEPRPTFMPAVLSEGVFLTKPYELYLIKQPRVRQSMAAAYYDAIQAYLGQRANAMGYSVIGQPDGAVEGASAEYQLRLVNKGMQTAAGWHLEARYVPAVLLYDGSPGPGDVLGTADVPTLGPGERVMLNLNLRAPPAGDWLIKFDTVRGDGSHLSDLGSPMLQLPLSVSAAP